MEKTTLEAVHVAADRDWQRGNNIPVDREDEIAGCPIDAESMRSAQPVTRNQDRIVATAVDACVQSVTWPRAEDCPRRVKAAIGNKPNVLVRLSAECAHELERPSWAVAR
jgi:hypothetical protein